MVRAAEPAQGAGLPQDVSVETLLRFHRDMVLIRRFEEKVNEMYTKAKIGGYCHLNIGEEAVIVGSMAALTKDDYILASYREHGHAIARGMDPRRVMAELFGKETGVAHGRGGSMHLLDASLGFLGGWGIVGGHLPIAAGVAFAIKYRGGHQVVATYTGEGSTNIGAFHEALNIAGVWKLPVLWIISNNGYEMGTQASKTSAITEQYKKATIYATPSEPVDGLDVLKVYEATQRAVRHIRSHGEPYLLEIRSYRYRGHSVIDPARYRSEEDVRAWASSDPIARYRALLTAGGVLNEALIKQVEDEVEAVVEDAVRFADESPFPDPASLFDNLYYVPEGKEA